MQRSSDVNGHNPYKFGKLEDARIKSGEYMKAGKQDVE